MGGVHRQGRDHPRTRGVYPTEEESWETWEGSSPHTRGLPRSPACGASRSGIIPAHAGFTGAPGGTQARCRDHPRTRGVCDCRFQPYSDPDGSSPHTRGLRPQETVLDQPVRIIPAHAGFTRKGKYGSLITGDHPRTRGVYSTRALATWEATGSSPHTRGLRTSPSTNLPGSWDHPRTRGVYERMQRRLGGDDGSSPHTRGLQQARHLDRPRPGIIPAHAGFTSPTSSSHPRRRDHPRTRGVYTRGQATWSVGGGSSPHTRGLRLHRRRPLHEGRIIPAHAGFTRTGF